MVFSRCMSLMCIAALVTTAEDPKPRSKREYLEFEVRGPGRSVAVEKGQDTVLKYQLDPPINAERMKIQCYRSNFQTLPENVCLNGTLNSSMTELSLNSRIYLMTRPQGSAELHVIGGVHLHVYGVQSADEGTYLCCFITKYRAKDSVTDLYVKAIGSGPTINIGKTPASVELACSASDWHPKPEVWWEGSSGENLTLDLLSESIPVARAGNYTCHVKSHRLNRTKSTAVSVQDSLLRNPSCVLPWSLLGITAIILCAIVLWIVNKKGNYIERIRSWFMAATSKDAENHNCQNEWDAENENCQNERVSLTHQESFTQQDGPALFTEVTVTLEENSASNRLDINRDQNCVKLKGDAMLAERPPVAFGKDGFTKGKHSWKVHVGEAKKWALGVAEESVGRTENSNLLERKGVWAVGLTAGQYQAFTSPLTSLSPDPHPVTLVVYLDIAGGQLSFYNADTLRHIFTYMICFGEEVFPFIWTMDQKNWITVSPP